MPVRTSLVAVMTPCCSPLQLALFPLQHWRRGLTSLSWCFCERVLALYLLSVRRRMVFAAVLTCWSGLVSTSTSFNAHRQKAAHIQRTRGGRAAESWCAGQAASWAGCKWQCCYQHAGGCTICGRYYNRYAPRHLWCGHGHGLLQSLDSQQVSRVTAVRAKALYYLVQCCALARLVHLTAIGGFVPLRQKLLWLRP